MPRVSASEEIVKALRLMDTMLGSSKVMQAICHADREVLTEMIGFETPNTVQRNRIYQLWARYGPVHEGLDNAPGSRERPPDPRQVSRHKTKMWS